MKTVGDVMQHKARLQRERLESEGLTGGEVYSIPAHRRASSKPFK